MLYRVKFCIHKYIYKNMNMIAAYLHPITGTGVLLG